MLPMPLGSDELSRIVDQTDIDRTIMHSVYCGNCGYNLRFAHYVGQCTECGHSYNARPGAMKGIFDPHDVRFPMREILLTVLCAGFGGWIIYSGVNPVNDWLLILGGAILLLGLSYIRIAYRESRRFILALRIRRRIQEDDE